MPTDKPPYTTTDSGIPATSDEYSLTVGPGGPILLQDHYVIQKMQHFNRERVPERVVHAKGGGAFGFFETTEDVSEFTKAALFQKGVRTDMVARFSTVALERGSADTVRDPRGFALKFYTDQGNYDMVGNNTPIFFVRDPTKFQDFIHSQKRRADSHLRDHNMQWDFWTLSPESAHMVTWLMGDRGLPRSWRQMNGYSSHTYMWINGAGKRSWVKYHFKTDLGVHHLTQAEGDALAGQDPDHHLRDLYAAIKDGDHPSWTLYMQIMPFDDAADYRFNPFDLTKVWPHGDYPLIKVGRMVLDRNPDNYFARDRAGRVRAQQHGPRHRTVAGQDAARATVQLPRHPSAPGGAQRHGAPGQPAPLAGQLLQPGRRHAVRQPGRPGVRAELVWRTGRGPRAVRAGSELVGERRDRAGRLRGPSGG